MKNLRFKNDEWLIKAEAEAKAKGKEVAVPEKISNFEFRIVD